MDIRKGLANYYSLFGIKGVFTISAYHLFGLPKEIVTQPPGIKHPLRLRIRTSDLYVYRTILLEGEYAMPLPSAPRTIIDAGANIGITTIYYANKFPQAKIVAIEPEPSNFVALLNNVARYPNVTPIQAALWNRNCSLNLGSPKIESPGYDKFRFQIKEKGTIPVPGMTMRTLMEKVGLDSIDLLKMDIEGAEIEAFENCDWIDSVQAIAVELHDHLRSGCSEALRRVTKGFRSWNRDLVTFYLRA
jgi:FkbM family methyltransferase